MRNIIDLDRWEEIMMTITRNKTRSILTAFGVFWGIFMLIVLIGGGNGMRVLIGRSFSSFATNSCFVSSHPTSEAYKAGMGVGLGAGIAMAQQMTQNMMNSSGKQNEQDTPPPLPGEVLYYVAIDGQQSGPYNLVQLGDLVEKQMLNRESLVWKKGLSEWVPAGNQVDLQSLWTLMPPPLPQ